MSACFEMFYAFCDGAERPFASLRLTKFVRVFRRLESTSVQTDNEINRFVGVISLYNFDHECSVYLPERREVGAMHVCDPKDFREVLHAVGVIEARALLQNSFIILPFHIHSFPGIIQNY